jgi:hypothetical protein
MATFTGPDISAGGSLKFALDFGNPKCYPGSGATVTDLASGNTSQLDNYGDTPAYSSSFGGCLDFSGGKRFYFDVPTLNNENSYSVIWFGADGAGDQYSGVSRAEVWQTGNHLVGWRTGAINSDIGRDTNTNTSGDQFMICHTNNTSTKAVDQYLNGVYYGTFNYTSWTSKNRWTIGCRGDGNSHQYDGKIGVILIYDGLITQDTIDKVFDRYRNRFGI